MDRTKRFDVLGTKKTESPTTFENKTDRKKFGIKIRYEKPRECYTAWMGETEYDVEGRRRR
jgi:hypothetical protein